MHSCQTYLETQKEILRHPFSEAAAALLCTNFFGWADRVTRKHPFSPMKTIPAKLGTIGNKERIWQAEAVVSAMSTAVRRSAVVPRMMRRTYQPEARQVMLFDSPGH